MNPHASEFEVMAAANMPNDALKPCDIVFPQPQLSSKDVLQFLQQNYGLGKLLTSDRRAELVPEAELIPNCTYMYQKDDDDKPGK